jgi:hypothetical protein
MRRECRSHFYFGFAGFRQPFAVADGLIAAASWLFCVAAWATAPVFSPVP